VADHQSSPLDILLATLRNAAPNDSLATTSGPGLTTPAGLDACSALPPVESADFAPTLALSRHRDLLTRFIVATGVDLASNHDAAALLAQLHALGDDIHSHIGNACEDLAGACEGLDLFVTLVDQGVHSGVNGSQVRSLLNPLLGQFDRATRAVGNLL